MDKYLPPVIVDIGSGFMKAGLQTDEEGPSCVIPTFVGRPRKRFVDDFEGSPLLVADDAISMRHRLSFVYPVDHGHIEDWVEVEALFQYIFEKGVAVEPKDRAVLLTEPPMASSSHRERLVEMALEAYEASEVNLSIQAIMALYATGRTTGLVLEAGEGVTQVVPVHDGFIQKSSIRRADMGGLDITMYLQKTLCNYGYPLTSRDDFEHIRSVKESVCYAAQDPSVEDSCTDIDATYSLPDGMVLRDGSTTITVGAERFYCVETLFNPRIVQRDCPSVIELLWQAVQASPMETRKYILASIIVSGGTSLFPGFPERVEAEMVRIAPPQAKSVVRVHANEDRLFGVWMGAKLFCEPGLRTVQAPYWISRDDWEEEGGRAVARKIPVR